LLLQWAITPAPSRHQRHHHCDVVRLASPWPKQARHQPLSLQQAAAQNSTCNVRWLSGASQRTSHRTRMPCAAVESCAAPPRHNTCSANLNYQGAQQGPQHLPVVPFPYLWHALCQLQCIFICTLTEQPGKSQSSLSQRLAAHLWQPLSQLHRPGAPELDQQTFRCRCKADNPQGNWQSRWQH
jgi:hypothetical protein